MTDSQFLAGYLEALTFTDMQPGDECAECALSDALRAQAARDCERFQFHAAASLARAYERGDYDAAQAGRDFWFTRNGHGVGFWDRPQLAGDLGDELSAAAHDKFGACEIYRGDDGLVYSI